MKMSTGLIAVLVVLGLGSAASVAAGLPGDFQQIQYDRYPDQPPGGYYPNQPRDDYYPNQPPRGYYPDQPRDGYSGGDFDGVRRWRAGQVLPGQLLDFVIEDWDDRGLGRPPGGHLWVRVGQQFVLVRERDRMIAGVISFD
jgi:Ni/Co efflux regulator RcnB